MNAIYMLALMMHACHGERTELLYDSIKLFLLMFLHFFSFILPAVHTSAHNITYLSATLESLAICPSDMH